ncbi:HTH-type transcriptional regulator PrtR [Shewanella benthica]|uniref:HTH-type transcriptional regulator PrtR n=1 Tax=Shewanella benthica TaxID=43661 RepID=A0A330M6E1_9GAMM|nr:helix-turn-helix transcriptional regulator [Shewanella benthica]SQH76964.1 HTH-type transcriptional regulator PrtR [Shewanella benthica]
MKTLGIRSKERRKLIKLTQLELSKLVGVSSVTISQWESGDTSPNGQNLYKLAKALKCDPDWLLFGHDKNFEGKGSDWTGSLELWGNETVLSKDEVEVPFFTEVELSAGDGNIPAQENHGPKLRFARSTLKRLGVQPENVACVKVSGNSMEPVLPNGSTVGVDTDNKTVTDGKMYAINHDGMLRVKLVYRLPGNGIRLRSYNADEYPDERYDEDQAKYINMIGKVFWYSVLL